MKLSKITLQERLRDKKSSKAYYQDDASRVFLSTLTADIIRSDLMVIILYIIY